MVIGYSGCPLGIGDIKERRCSVINATEGYLEELTRLNFEAFEKAIDYNIVNGIKLFGMSEYIVPFAGHPLNNQKWWCDYETFLSNIGKKIKENNMTILIPSNKNIRLDSKHDEVVQEALNNIEYKALLLNVLGLDYRHKIIVRIGAGDTEKNKAKKRFIKVVEQLAEDLRSRIILENDFHDYNIRETLEMGKILNLPVFFNKLNHELYRPKENLRDFDWIRLCKTTWKDGDGIPKISYSQLLKFNDSFVKSDTITIKSFLEFYEEIKKLDIQVMIDAADRNLSVIKCINCTSRDIIESYIIAEWERYKYLVLSKSFEIFSQVNEMIEKNNMDGKKFYGMLEKALICKFQKESELKAIQEMWLLLKERVSENETIEFEEMLKGNILDEVKLNAFKRYFLNLSIKYNIVNLIGSYYFIM